MPFKNTHFGNNCILNLSIWSSETNDLTCIYRRPLTFMGHHPPAFLCSPGMPCTEQYEQHTPHLSRSVWQANAKGSRPADGFSNKFTSTKEQQIQAYKGLTHSCFHCVVLLWAIRVVLQAETAKRCFQGHSMLHDILSDITSSPLKCWLAVSLRFLYLLKNKK